MKFVSSKKVTDYALELHKLQNEQAKLQARMREIKAEAEALEEFLEAKLAGENFQFADRRNHLMELDFIPCSRKDIDGDAVRRFYAKLGKKVPIKESTWTNVRVKYVTE
jgi:glutathione S-transferase